MSKIIGLTGPTGAGKSAVSQFLKSKGIVVIDCDTFAKQVTDQDEECFLKIKQHFPECVENQKINRKKLGKIVFADAEKLKTLNAIVNPVIVRELQTEIARHTEPIVILDGATLLQSGAEKLCDFSVAILADQEIRANRTVLRDQLEYEQAMNRINSQPNDNYYKERCKACIYNNFSIDQTNKEVWNVIKGGK